MPTILWSKEVEITDFGEALAQLNCNSDGNFSGPKSALSIDYLEDTLEVVLPASYRHFLAKLGSGDIFGIEIFGITRENTIGYGIPDLIWLTKELRKNGLPAKLIPVLDSGDGGFYVLDTAVEFSNSECPVALYFFDGSIENVSDNFAGFFMQQIMEAR